MKNVDEVLVEEREGKMEIVRWRKENKKDQMGAAEREEEKEGAPFGELQPKVRERE